MEALLPIIVQVITGIIGGQAVGAALKSGEPVATAIGSLTYGETGDLTSPSFSLFKWEDGKIVSVE